MSFVFKEFESMEYGQQSEIAGLISAYTKGELDEKPQMLPMEPADIFGKHVGYVALKEGAFSGYIGAMQPLEHNGQQMVEAGSLWVPRGSRHQGIAHKLLGLLTGSLVAEHETPYAFCNPLSEGIFTQMGYAKADFKDVPREALAACASCPCKPQDGGCCDEIVVFNRALS